MTNDNNDNDDKKTIDMYHFFSRKDVWLFVAVILLLLMWATFKYLHSTKGV